MLLSLVFVMANIDSNNITPELIKQKFPKYTVPLQCSKDLSITLKEFNDLQLYKRECVVEGHLYDMINLEGTIHVVYKGDSFNIPVRVMLQEDYPRSPPIVYVQPTEEMKIAKNIPYLNGRGKVTTTYLHEWEKQNHPDLYKVLHQLCILFADYPPVWTKKAKAIAKAYEDRSRRNKERKQATVAMDAKQSNSLHVIADGSSPNWQVSKDQNSKKSVAYPSVPPSTLPSMPQDGVQGFQPFDPSQSVKNEGEFIPTPYANDDRRTSVDDDETRQPVHGAEGGPGHVPSLKQKTDSNVLTTYSCKDLIGSGGFSKVYLYEHPKTKDKVACKIVDLGVNDSNVKKYAEALKHEIKLLKPLRHDFIINYMALEEHLNKLAIVMEYFPMGSLYSVMMNYPDEHLDESTTRRFTWQILQGLMYLHDNGIIHKDIKARNILVDQHTIKIADFGISKKMKELATATSVSTDQFGSMYWQSPEFLANVKYGRKTDVWSLGCTVVEMLLGRPPLLCDDIPITAACARILGGKVCPPPDSSDIAREFLELCFRFENDRPTARELMSTADFPAVSL